MLLGDTEQKGSDAGEELTKPIVPENRAPSKPKPESKKPAQAKPAFKP